MKINPHDKKLVVSWKYIRQGLIMFESDSKKQALVYQDLNERLKHELWLRILFGDLKEKKEEILFFENFMDMPKEKRDFWTIIQDNPFVSFLADMLYIELKKQRKKK